MGLNISSQLIKQFDQWGGSLENAEKYNSGEKVEDFKMFDFNAPTYSSDLKDFAKAHIAEYDSDDDGEWNRNEFMKMAAEMNDDEVNSYNTISQVYEDIKASYSDFIDKHDTNGDRQLSAEEFIDVLGEDMLKQIADVDGDPDNISADELTLAVEYSRGFENIETAYLVNQMVQQINKTFDTMNIDDNQETITAEEYAANLFTEDLDYDVYDMKTGDNLIPALDGKLDYENHQLFAILSKGQLFDNKEYMKNWFYNQFYNKAAEN